MNFPGYTQLQHEIACLPPAKGEPRKNGEKEGNAVKKCQRRKEGGGETSVYCEPLDPPPSVKKENNREIAPL